MEPRGRSRALCPGSSTAKWGEAVQAVVVRRDAASTFLETWDFDGYIEEFRTGKEHHRRAEVAEKIQDRGLFLQPVTYPAVPKHKSRLRISVSAAHTEADLETAVRVIASVLREEGACQ